MTPIARIYEACIERPGDVMYLPSALMVLLQNGQSHIFSEGGMHNFWRSACARYAWSDLESGMVVDGHHIRLHDVTDPLEQLVPREAWTIPALLQAWYEQNPRQHFYLRRHVKHGSS
ncbi:hypothetical protein IW967_12365 [Alicyclobacillus mali]|uniref:Uncharacterized protein n=1 Tax=Alicyclobacillus mali (ex Roth et al. 2021) TaxID=1123961 RepID=A0ABS0F5R6_9BACL|nr:hypothetical protein [Alicyclobacillus mali (ex Roth et al. 2021)]MBF8378649.1 hypothetical protein [Alicyclobacillus mali (ex Roth et al. 2021)]MCL6487484.1 hypothetical protein [Alicyclobacillus mali (ex Roth et al. 2021)]